jgi:hypothetical protein
MAMGTGAKIAIGCGCLLLLAGAAVLGVVGMGAWWAKDKITEATGGLDKITAKAEEIGRWEEKANANPYARSGDGVIPEARFVKFLETRKSVYSVYERYEADLRTLQNKAEAAGDKLSPSDLWSAGGKLAEVFSEIRLAQMKALAAVGMSEPERIEGDGGPGTIVDFSMSPPGGRPFRATCRVVEYEHRADGSVHWRGEYSGGNSGWETWDLHPVDGGASATVEMEVVPSGGVLVRVAANLFVQRPMRRNVHQSLENLKRLVESA